MIEGGRESHGSCGKEVLLSIVIPAFNERSRLKKTVFETLEWCSRMIQSFEIIIVDDGSNDGTLDIARSLSRSDIRVKVLARPHFGKGAAVKEGMLNANREFILFMDANGATPLNEIRKLLQKWKRDTLLRSDPGLLQTQKKQRSYPPSTGYSSVESFPRQSTSWPCQG